MEEKEIKAKEYKEEKKVEVKKESKDGKEASFITIKKPSFKRISKWKVSTFVLGILLIAAIFTNGFGLISLSGKSADEVGENTLNYINTNLLRGVAVAEMGEVSEEDGLYKALLTISGESNYVYMTKDGTLLFVQAIPIGNVNIQNTGTGNQNVQDIETVEVSEDDDPVKGDLSAPITIIEFSDFQCPYCAKFYTDTLPQLEQEYIDTGKVKIVYRDFPLTNIHPLATPAALAAECANEQDKFWEYHNILFEKQDEWVNIGEDKLKEYATEIGLNEEQFNSCLDSEKYKDEVLADLDDGASAGVTGTPAFFVNGRMLSGAQPLSAFQSIIEEELAST